MLPQSVVTCSNRGHAKQQYKNDYNNGDNPFAAHVPYLRANPMTCRDTVSTTAYRRA